MNKARRASVLPKADGLVKSSSSTRRAASLDTKNGYINGQLNGHPEGSCLGPSANGVAAAYGHEPEDDSRSRRIRFKVDVLGVPLDKADALVDRADELYNEVVSGPPEIPEPIEAKFTLEQTPLSAQEREYWDRKLEFSMNVLGLSRQEAAEHTKYLVERYRQHASKAK